EHAKLNIEQRAMSVLKGNKLTILDGISVLVTDKEVNLNSNAKVRIGDYYVYLVDSLTLEKAKIKANVIHKYENCSAIIIHSEENVESVSGVMAFVTSLFAEYDIN